MGTYQVSIESAISVPLGTDQEDLTFEEVTASLTFEIRIVDPCLATVLEAFEVPDQTVVV